MSVAELSEETPARVVSIGGTGAVRQRLLDLGILPEARLEVARRGVGGSPVWVRLRGAQLALRRREAESIQVEPL